MKIELMGPVKITVKGGEITIETGRGALVVAPPDKAANENAGQPSDGPLTLADTILKFAREKKEPIKAADVAKALKIPAYEVRTYLSYLTRKGLLRRVRRGVYVAAEGA